LPTGDDGAGASAQHITAAKALESQKVISSFFFSVFVFALFE